MRRFVPSFFLLIAAFILFRTALYQSNDFRVMWRTAVHVLAGEQAYDLLRDGPMCFKYPPWIIPVFFPFALFGEHMAVVLWALSTLASLGLVVLWLVRQGVSLKVTLWCLVGFWGIWAVHFMDGQVSLPILAFLLWVCKPNRGAAAIWVLSTKVFNWGAVLAEAQWLSIKSIFGAAVVFYVLSLPAARAYSSVLDLVLAWLEASTSAGTLFDGEKIRGRDNQGFPALVLRLLSVDAQETAHEIYLFALLLFVWGGVWTLVSAKMNSRTRFLGWLALTVTVHPLAWWHSFVLAFPLCVITVDGAIREKRGRGLALAGFLMITMITRKTLGPLGVALELWSIKSWGVLLMLFWQFRFASRVSAFGPGSKGDEKAL